MTASFRIPPRPSGETHEYRYVCGKCSDDAWYVIKLPDHLLMCFGRPGVRGCGGRLALTETRPASTGSKKEGT